MNKLIKTNFKIFYKCLYLFIPSIIFFTLINIYLLMGIYNLSIHKDAFYYLQYSQKISMIFFVFFIFISYEYLIKSKSIDLSECILSINNGNIKLHFSKFIVLIIIMTIMTLNVFIYNLIVYFIMNINFLPYLYHILLNNILNIFLVSFFAVSIGGVISLYFKRFSSYALMIFASILVSPITEFIPYVLYMGYGMNIYLFRDIVNVLPPNLNWVGEKLYGLSIETYRWNILLFWTSFLLSIIILKLNKAKYKLATYITVVLVAISILNFYQYTKPASIVKKDYNPNSYVAFDELYYMKDVQKEYTENFKIKSYDMKFNIDRQLNSDITIYLEEKEPQNNYKFTLYRNYKIDKIIDKNNKDMTFKREGDYFEIINLSNKKLESVRILYSGYSSVFYSNSQGVLLPGCFPYYPMEGYKRIYIKEESKFIPVIRDYNTKFDVSVKANLKIHSNLKQSKNIFSGEAQELTLLGGFIEEKVIGNTTVLGLVLERLDKDFFPDIEQALVQYKQKISENDDINIRSKKIFQASETLSSRVIGNGIINFGDHVFIPKLDNEIIAISLLQSDLPVDTNKRKINTVLFRYLWNKNSILNIPKELLENNPVYECHNLFQNKINDLGEEYVIKSTYEYLKDKNDKRDSITFIKNLHN